MTIITTEHEVSNGIPAREKVPPDSNNPSINIITIAGDKYPPVPCVYQGVSKRTHTNERSKARTSGKRILAVIIHQQIAQHKTPIR